MIVELDLLQCHLLEELRAGSEFEEVVDGDEDASIDVIEDHVKEHQLGLELINEVSSFQVVHFLVDEGVTVKVVDVAAAVIVADKATDT